VREWAVRETRWLVFLLLFSLVLVTRPSIHGNDGVQNYAYLRSVLIDGDLDFTNEYTHYFSNSAEWFDNKLIPRDSITGRPINLYGVGSSVLWAPWVLAFHSGASVLRKFGVEVTLDGYSRLYECAVGYASATYASLGLFLLYVLLRKWVSRQTAFWTVLITWLATPLFFYMYLHPSMSHANSFFLSVLISYLYWRGPDSASKWLGMGAVAGLLTLTRFQDGILLLPIALAEIWRLLELARHCGWDRRIWMSLLRRAKRWAACGGCFFSVCLLQLAAWKVLHGSAFSGPRGYLSQGQVDLFYPRHVLSALFSPFHGLFHWHPVLLLGLIGFALRSVPRKPRLYAAAGFAAQGWVVGSWSIWWAGASFGQRMFISTLPSLAIGVAAVVARLERKWAWLVFLIFAVGTAWNFGLVVQYATRMIPRQAPVTIVTLARNNLFEVPRLLVGGSKGTEKEPEKQSR
jgi:hypothetical protein